MVQERLVEADRLFTVGYEGLDLPAFVDLLRSEGIEQLVDVRDNAWSRKPGFSKTPLSEALDAAGVTYEHLAELGSPKPLRDAMREPGATEQAFEQAYRAHLDEQAHALERLAELARMASTAIMCLEKDPSHCHRRMIAERFEQAGWAIVHLR